MRGALFADRRAAGRELASLLALDSWPADTIVLALPRGGVPVAFEIARRLGAGLDVLVVRKLGAPGAPEFALGALASGGVIVIDEQAALTFSDPQALRATMQAELQELQRREAVYRGNEPMPSLANRPVILVDDGAATGASMLAALRAARRLGARSITVALPVASQSACDALRAAADALVTGLVPTSFSAVGEWYERFEQVSDKDVCDLLAQARTGAASMPQPARATRD